MISAERVSDYYTKFTIRYVIVNVTLNCTRILSDKYILLSGNKVSAGDRALLFSPRAVFDTDRNVQLTIMFYYSPNSTPPPSRDTLTTLEVARFWDHFIYVL